MAQFVQRVRRGGAEAELVDDLLMSRRVFGKSLLYSGGGEVIDRIGWIYNPTALADVVTFEVPGGRVAEIDQIGLSLSEPFYFMGETVSWRPAIDGAQLPYVYSNVAGFRTAWRYGQAGSVYSPAVIRPVYVQTGQTFSLQVNVAAAFNMTLTVMGRFCGRLYDTGGGRV